jgi:alkane 1-monooxygenase
MIPGKDKALPISEMLFGAYFPYGLFLSFAVGYTRGGLWWSLPALFIVAFVPLLDSIFGEDLSPRQSPASKSFTSSLMRFSPHGFVTGHAICIALLVHAARHWSVFEICLATFSTGMIGSIGITAAHELVHKSAPIDKAFGRLGLANVMYLHFEINHLRGHHVQVGTPEDESTAWKGESLYAFIARTVPGCLSLSWRLEVKRLERKQIPLWSLQNLMLQFVVVQLVYFCVMFALGGWLALLLFVLQASVAIFMLESVAYIEHYGALREALPNHRFGNMTPAHSWDSYFRFSNYLTFHLQRHADHHTTPTKSFAELQPEAERAPRLPAGYPVLINLAMCPPLWRRTMDRRIPR